MLVFGNIVNPHQLLMGSSKKYVSNILDEMIKVKDKVKGQIWGILFF